MPGSNNNFSHTVDINSKIGIFAAMYINIIGASVFIVQPGFIQLLVSDFGYSAESAGYIASAEMWGIALTTVLLSFLVKLVNWRSILAVASMFILVGNFGSVIAGSLGEFATWRFIAGIGYGALISLGFTLVGITNHPERNFGLTIVGILIYGAIGLFAMPAAGEMVGIEGVIIFFGLLGGSVFSFLKFLPTSGEGHHQVEEEVVEMPELQKYLGISAMFFYFLAQGIIWAYLFLIGTAAGAGEQAVANGLTLSQIVGIAGAFIAATVGIRYGRVTPIMLGVLGGIFSVIFLFDGADIILYTVIVCVFNFTWNMTHPYLLATMASFERGGRIVTYAVSGQMIGLAVGPALGALVLEGDNFNNVISLSIVAFVISICAILPPLLLQQKLAKEKEVSA